MLRYCILFVSFVGRSLIADRICSSCVNWRCCWLGHCGGWTSGPGCRPVAVPAERWTLQVKGAGLPRQAKMRTVSSRTPQHNTHVTGLCAVYFGGGGARGRLDRLLH
eukprot:3443273-Amphidinium_carterae.1